MTLFFRKKSAKPSKIEAETHSEDRRILILDDDMMGCELMQFNLEHDGYKVDVFNSCDEAFDHDLSVYCLYIINVASEATNGMRLAQYLKQRGATSKIPLIFCSSVECEESIINGLDFGADDYLLKPFSMRELTARVNALLRRKRMSSPAKPAVILHHGLRLDTEAKSASINGDTIPLDSAEYNLLEFLLQNRNNIYDADVIYDNLWPEEETVDDAMIDRLVRSLKSKLGHNSMYLVDRLGFGYGYVE
ncbi:MAG: response regulator transcription factor [Muribaculum sp.]|nr:response regulator transcription factor [Muribaculum sp.]